MTPNPVYQLLLTVATTQQLPADQHIRELLTHPDRVDTAKTRAQLDGARRGITNAARKVLADVEAGYPHHVPPVAQAAADKYARYTN